MKAKPVDMATATADADVGVLRLAALGRVPSSPKLVADDITPEAIPGLLESQGGRVAILSEEGGIFATLSGRYTSGVPNLDVVLKAHSGDSITVHRKTSDPIQVEHPALTFGLAVQPKVIEGLAEDPNMSGRVLLARFLYAVPDMNARAVCGSVTGTPGPYR